ncbi:YccS family putative transporter [Curvibacter sp. HBC61]|uniref:YccS family putative transporter n=1 Tax=Curvibacter cyanobacteriorum TaxID=3026422 RepID=A0ABT5N496_9BURK|nr:YccS family putative transporter [Curvibacter sp. HBC61]MDD0841090.1 YccS family putative transporter [Curvibacter sp. HBC61]
MVGPVWQWGWQKGWTSAWPSHWQHHFLLRGVRPLIALACVMGLAWWQDDAALVIPLVLGVNASALAETDDSWRGRLRAQLTTLLCFTGMALAVQLTLTHPVGLMLVLALAAVGLALLGALGERYRAISSATLILGLYAALSAQAAADGQPEVGDHVSGSLLLLAGAAWYGLISVLWAALFPRLQVRQNLSALYEALGEYLRLKARLFEPVRGVDLERRRIGLALQNGRVVQALNETKESLFSRQPPGAGAQDGPVWLRQAFAQYLVAQDLHERASSSHAHYERLSQVFFHSDVLYRCQRVLGLVGQACLGLAQHLREAKPAEPGPELPRALEDLEGAIARLEAQPWSRVAALAQADSAEVGLAGDGAELSDPLRTLRSLAANLAGMGQVLAGALNPAGSPQSPTDTRLLDRNPRDLADAWDRVRSQARWASPLLRHGLRLAVALVAGFAWMEWTGDEHGFWILLTIVFVCRPYYGDTLRRLAERVTGTVLGLVVGWALLTLFPGVLLQSAFTVVAGVVFVATRQIRYTVASAAITALVLLAFNQVGNGFDLIVPRLVDTLIGSLIAGLSVWLVLPSWQSRQLPRLAARALRSQADYLREISAQYQSGKQDHLAYRLARRNAHNADAALSNAMTEVFVEPAYLRRHGKAGMRLLVQCHTLLNYLSALGAHRHKGHAASFHGAPEQAVAWILQSLDQIARALEGQGPWPPQPDPALAPLLQALAAAASASASAGEAGGAAMAGMADRESASDPAPTAQAQAASQVLSSQLSLALRLLPTLAEHAQALRVRPGGSAVRGR